MSRWNHPTEASHQPRRRRRTKKPQGPPSPWAAYSPVFRAAIRSGFSLEGRVGTAAEWDREMLRALGPNVSMTDVIQAAIGGVKFLGPVEVFAGLRARWGRPA